MTRLACQLKLNVKFEVNTSDKVHHNLKNGYKSISRPWSNII